MSNKPTLKSEEPLILHLESATSVCSVCISRGDNCIAIRESSEPYVHSKMMGVYVKECLADLELSVGDLDAICVSSGPGSYTGLRVGASLAKGLCYSSGVPLIAVETLLSLAHGSQSRYPEVSLFFPMIDARRDEVYLAIFDSTMKRIIEDQPRILDADMFETHLSKDSRALIVGDGTRKASALFTDQRITCDENITCSAQHMILPALIAYQRDDFVDVFSFAPGYLKAPNITKSKKSMV